jgi:hypothetical protein
MGRCDDLLSSVVLVFRGWQHRALLGTIPGTLVASERKRRPNGALTSRASREKEQEI